MGGTDDSRQNNLMNYETTDLALIGDVQMGNQLLTFGYENTETTVFNMFMQESIGGEWDFKFSDDGDGIYALGEGNVAFDFQNTSTLNPRDASKEWTYDVTTLFIQSEVAVSSELDVTYGIRYEKHGVPEGPTANADFESTYGYTNALTYDGEEAIMPRISFSYRPNDVTEYYGGFGVFSGGNPAVWFSNNYSNNGVSIIDGDGNYNAFTDAMCNPLNGAASDGSDEQGPGYFVPCGAIAKVQAGSGGGDTNSLDPNFEMPTHKKISLGMNTQIGEYDVTVDYMWSRNKNPLYVYNLANVIGDYADTGHAISTAGGCCTGDYSLANSDQSPKTTVFSVMASRSFENDIDVTFGYTNTNANDVHPMASSVAYTNANENLVSLNPNDPAIARSDWEIEHRFVSTINWMVSDKTNVSLFFQRASGNPYSLSAYGSWTELGLQPGWRTEDFPSIPIVINDNTSFEDSAVGMMNLGNGTLERNAFTTVASSRLDMKVTHTPMDNLDLYVVVRNLGNLISGNSGQYYRSSSANGIANASFDGGSVTYSDYVAPSTNAVIGSASIWNVKLGFKYSF
jgi:hypothetical protein